MTKSPNEIFSDKVSLIFEYDKTSPLFVRQANTEIENNNVERAIEILTEGIKLYSDYPTAYILYSKALSLVGEYGNALNQAKTASDLLHSKKTYEFYLREIENIKKRSSLFNSNRGTAFIPDSNYFVKHKQQELFEEELEKRKNKNLNENSEQSGIDERLGELAEEISSARISDVPFDNNGDNPNNELTGTGSTIVSETLAKIYAAQGEYKEAIRVYEKLIYKTPAKEDEYIHKINELNSRLES